MMERKGFTLIEILVVITIIGILAGLTLTASLSSRKVARDGKRKADLEQIRSALEIYRSDCKIYPPSINFGSGLFGLESSCQDNTYMEKVPNDPLPGYKYVYYKKNPTDNNYFLCSYLETNQITKYNYACGGVGGAGVCGSSSVKDCYYGVTNY